MRMTKIPVDSELKSFDCHDPFLVLDHFSPLGKAKTRDDTRLAIPPSLL